MLDDSFFFPGLCFCKHLHFKLNSILHVANCVLPPNAMQYMMQMNTHNSEHGQLIWFVCFIPVKNYVKIYKDVTLHIMILY